MSSGSESRKRSGRLAKLAGVGLAGTGVSHFTSPRLFEPITKAAFPRRTRRHVYTNGGIETAIGLGLISRRTRNLAVVGGIGYLAYLAGSAARNMQRPG